jgi:hypothetical protein
VASKTKSSSLVVTAKQFFPRPDSFLNGDRLTHTHWSTPHMNNSAASQEEREKERAGAVGKSNQNLHTNNLFLLFSFGFVTTNRNKKQSE